MSISGIFAFVSQETNGVISTDIVDIKITNFKLDENNTEIEYSNESSQVTPGDVISIIPKINNNGMNCYLRVKVKYINDNTDFTNYVTGFSGDFTKYGDYYYYNKVFNSAEQVKLFDTIKIPEDINEQSTSTGKIELVITAEAIQDRNFEPDYSLSDPWKNVQPEATINNTYEIDEENSKVMINYEDETEKDILISDDLFVKAKKMVPGDGFADTISIKNTHNSKAKYYLQLNADASTEQYAKLLNQISLVITTQDGQVLYDGKLSSTGKIALGEYQPGEQGQLNYNVSVPLGLNNLSENLNPKLLFIFSAEYENKITPGQNSKSIKTGDTIDLAITVFLISAVGLVTIMILFYREKRKEEN